MLNDRSSILSLLETRRSGKPRELVGPGPDAEELERILTIAARVPDHGKLAPWRFVTVGDEQRDALALCSARRWPRKIPTRPPPTMQRRTSSPITRAAGGPGFRPGRDHKIPLWEQELSCGAAAMNLLLAAHALGFVAGWVTGWRTYSEPSGKPFASPANRSPGLSSSDMPAATWRSGSDQRSRCHKRVAPAEPDVQY